MKKYELMSIFKPNLDAEEVDKLIEKIESVIKDFGGSVESTDKAGRKKLAYEIQNFRDGYFSTMILSLPADKVAEFKRQLRLNDNILRTMFMESAKHYDGDVGAQGRYPRAPQKLISESRSLNQRKQEYNK